LSKGRGGIGPAPTFQKYEEVEVNRGELVFGNAVSTKKGEKNLGAKKKGKELKAGVRFD